MPMRVAMTPVAVARTNAGATRRSHATGVNGPARITPLRSAPMSYNSSLRLASRGRRVQVATTQDQKTSADGEDEKPAKITGHTTISNEELRQSAIELEKAAMAEKRTVLEASQMEAKRAAFIEKPEQLKMDMTFDESEGEKVWIRLKNTNALQRTLEIWGFIIKFLFKRWKIDKKWSYAKEDLTEGKGKEGIAPAARSQKLSELAVWLKDSLVKLGPTFIKAGQQFSTRVDVLDKEFIKELEQLQDNVPPFGIKAAKDIIEKEFGMPVDQKFTYFEEQPIAAASLGQVHRARIGAEEVVVKVQRPGLKDIFDIDLKNIRVLASLLQAADPKTDGAARDWVAIYDECARILYEEIDYKKEGENAEQFRNNFKGYDWAKIPKILWEHSSSRVLTMEYCPGIKINQVDELDKLGFDRKRLARLTVESYLLQILKFGLFHADPHPGNIAVDRVTGQIIYYDFGMMGNLKPEVKVGLNKLFYSIYQRNADEALVALKLMGVFVPSGDNVAVKRTAQFFINGFYERLETQEEERDEKGEEYSSEYKAKRTKDEKVERRKAILSNIGEDLLMVSKDQPFRFPATFTFVIRAFTVLDGLGKSLDKKFDISEISRPYARELLQEGSRSEQVTGSLIKRITRQNTAIVNLFKSPDRVEELYTTITQLQNGDFKLRVRALEAERALARVSKMQESQTASMMAVGALNIGTVLWVSEVALLSQVAFGASGLFALAALASLLKVKSLEKKDAKYSGA